MAIILRWRFFVWLLLLIVLHSTAVACQTTPVPAQTGAVDVRTAVPTARAVELQAAASIPEPPPQTPTMVPTSAPTLAPTRLPPTFTNPPDPALVDLATAWGAEFVSINRENTGLWRYPGHTFLHPIAMEVQKETAYLLDGGRVLALSLAAPAPPQVLLAPGDAVAGVRVLEPLDLALAADSLLVLDRAGDVYRYDPAAAVWGLERYDRPVRDTSGHYFVALAEDTAVSRHRYLLETNYRYTLRYSPGERERLWSLPSLRAVDVAAWGEDVYVLSREMDSARGQLLHYRQTQKQSLFSPPDLIAQPRQVRVGETAVFVLDKNGRRLLTLDRANGQLNAVYQLPAKVSAFWADAAGQTLILAGEDRLYFFRQPSRLAQIPGNGLLPEPQPHDLDFLDSVDGFVVPIGGSGIAGRDLQMPGAPRHYRLGIHQGADFYWQPGTPVRAAASGVVIRATEAYEAPTAVQFGAMRAAVLTAGYSTAEALDLYRGRQVWVRHDNGLITRYAHLSQIAPGIVDGVQVAQGQLLGAVGNSGSPLSLESETADAHLHFEIWRGEHYIGRFLRPIEARAWLETLFSGQ